MNEGNMRPDGRQMPGPDVHGRTGKQNTLHEREASGSTRQSALADAGSAYARRQGPLSGYEAGSPRPSAGAADKGGVSFRTPRAGMPPYANPRGYASPDPYRTPGAGSRPAAPPAGCGAGNPPAAPPRQGRPNVPAGQRTPVSQGRTQGYVDSLSEEPGVPAARERTKAPREKEAFTPKDKKQITALAVLDGVLFLFIAVMLLMKGDGALGQIKKIITPEADAFYDPASVFDELTPRLQASAYPDGIDPLLMPLYSENNDTVGWLRVPGTGIDNAVVQARDNNTYLRADFYRRPDKRTRLFFGDFRNNFTRRPQDYSKVTIIYGHHLSSDTRIFAQIENYADVEYYKTHPTVEFYSLYGKTTWKVFGVFYTVVNGLDGENPAFYYWNPSVTDAETPAFVNEIMTRSQFVNPAVDVQPTDKILCLSTCSYIVRKNYDIRCVLMARLVRDGEDPAVDVSAAYANVNRRMPHAWYVQQGLGDPYENTPVFTAGTAG